MRTDNIFQFFAYHKERFGSNLEVDFFEYLEVEEQHRYPVITKGIATVCDVFQITENHLIGQCRDRELVQARSVVAHIYEGVVTLKNIGLALGGRNHATIIHLRESFNNYMSKDPLFKSRVREVKRILKHKL